MAARDQAARGGHLIITVETSIAAPVELCFDLALDVDVHAESARFSGEHVVEPGRTSGVLQAGDLLTFEGRHFGIRQRFTTRITEVDRPRRFVDEMVRGFFRKLRHVHEFYSRDHGTLMRDVLEIEGTFAFLLKRHMRWFVATKQQHLKSIIEGRYH
ncbi:MAG TPA: SRPBCC family protein [Thermoanaerobaculia bacterium]